MNTKPKIKLPKVGAAVAFTRRNGERVEGRISGSDEKANGLWVAVNTAPRGKNPTITGVRPSKLTYL
jgi:hypothetical protein